MIPMTFGSLPFSLAMYLILSPGPTVCGTPLVLGLTQYAGISFVLPLLST